MLRRFLGLYERYALAHAGIAGRLGPIRDAKGRIIGRIEVLEADATHLRVTGHAEAGRVTLAAGGRRAETVRPEGLPGPLRFDLALPRPVLPAAGADGVAEADPRPRATLAADDAPPRALRFPPPALQGLGRAAGFGAGLVRLVPTLAGYALNGDPRHRSTVKRVLGLDSGAAFGPLTPLAGGTAAAAPGTPPRAISIVLPVHNGFELLAPCLDRVLAGTDLAFRLIVIEDGSTDPRVRPWLRDRLAAARRAGAGIELIEPGENLGFVGAVNLGLAAARALPDAGARPVVLLNSDAMVPPGWASRLTAPLADPRVASVTPMSNDAEITNVPVICAPGPLPEDAGDALDAAARDLAAAPASPMPTGVGFCMALAPGFLARLPALDPAFGRGYGEEVDWCQKARAQGGLHLGLPGLFVEHRGGASFGSADKAALIARNNAVIAQRYPAYDAEVQRFIATDPLRGPRLALALVWAAEAARAAHPRDPAVPVYLAHSLGGGAEIWLARQIARDIARGRPSAVLRVGGPERWQIELHAPGGVTGGTTAEAGQVADLLARLPRKRLIYSCGVGDPDPLALPGMLLGLKRPGDRLEVLLHDWLPVSPSYTLLDADGRYRGPVGPETRDPAHVARRPDGTRVPLAEWQAEWRRLLQAADRVRLFSEGGRAEIAAAFPDLDPARVEVAPHRMPAHDLRLDPPPRPAPGGAPVIGVIGNLNAHKGAAVVAALGRRIGRELGGVVVLGRVDPACPLPRRVRVAGGYKVPEIPALARRHGITHWLMPAVWPETFSFAVREALATGLPVLAFEIGAQGAAVAAAPNGLAVPFGEGIDPAGAVLERLAGRLAAPAAPRPAPGSPRNAT